MLQWIQLNLSPPLPLYHLQTDGISGEEWLTFLSEKKLLSILLLSILNTFSLEWISMTTAYSRVRVIVEGLSLNQVLMKVVEEDFLSPQLS